MKRNWIIIVLLFLLVANAALVSTWLITNKSNKPVDDSRSFLMRNAPNSRMQPMRFDNYMRDRIHLSEDQIMQVNEFRQEFQSEKFEYNTNLFELRAEYMVELSKDSPDEVKLNYLADSIGHIQAQLMLQEYQHYRNLRSVCTPEQVRAFDSLGRENIFDRNNYRNYSRNNNRERGSDRGWRQRQNEPEN